MLKHRLNNPANLPAAPTGSNNITGSQHDINDEFPAPPPDLDLMNNETHADTPQSNIGYNQQNNANMSNPEIVVQNMNYSLPPDGANTQNMHKSDVIRSSSNASISKQAIGTITERYDYVGGLSPGSHMSPLSSPSSEGSFSFTDVVMSNKFREGVTESDLLQVDTFYRSHKSEVYVCGCLVNMYHGSAKSALTNDQWTFSSTGIPLLLLDTGEHHRERKLSILIAEKGTGFTLWRDVIDNLTGYRTPNANFHTMHSSKDYAKLVGLSFDEAGAAAEFYSHVKKLTADPADELLKTGNTKKKKSIKDKKKKIKLPKKTEISNPCCFVHVTKLEPEKVAGYDPAKNENDKQTNKNEISSPYDFHHITAPPTSSSSEVESVSSMVGSKMTLTNSSSVDSGLSEDRSST
ncbi:hypothetical protein ACF0H5_008403 [Mactra antiquata]